MADLVEQATKLASNFPIGCKVRVKAEDVPGRVEGYQEGGTHQTSPTN